MTALVKAAPQNDTALEARIAESSARMLMRPIARPAEVLEALEETRPMLARTLVEGVDFGVIPGTDKDKSKAPKKVMLKPGAEKVAFSFGCRPEFEIVEAEVDHERAMRFRSGWVEAPSPSKDEKERLKAEGKGRNRKVDGEWQWQVPGDGWDETMGLYRFVIRCKLVRYDGVTVGEKLGVCSSLESKYRSRPHDVENTVMQMAEKRAFVGAVLTAFGLSEAFTMDLEDELEREKPVQQARAPQQPQAPRADPVRDLMMAAKREMQRLRIGFGMSEPDQKAAYSNLCTRINSGRAPETVEEWAAVVELLKEEPTPTIPADDVGDPP
jgi:hypothetical protein